MIIFLYLFVNIRYDNVSFYLLTLKNRLFIIYSERGAFYTELNKEGKRRESVMGGQNNELEITKLHSLNDSSIKGGKMNEH